MCALLPIVHYSRVRGVNLTQGHEGRKLEGVNKRECTGQGAPNPTCNVPQMGQNAAHAVCSPPATRSMSGDASSLGNWRKEGGGSNRRLVIVFWL